MELKLYFIVFSYHKTRDWYGAGGYIFAYDEGSIQKLLEEEYGEVRLRSVREISITEGTLLFGERWVAKKAGESTDG